MRGVARIASRREAATQMKTDGDDSECMARLAAGDAERAARALSTTWPRAAAVLRGHVPLAPGRRRPGARHFRGAAARAGICSIPRRARVFGYLCGVLRHRVSRHFRQQKRWVALDDDDDGAGAREHRPRPRRRNRAHARSPRAFRQRHARAAAAASRSHRAVRSRRAAVRHASPPSSTARWAPCVRACIARAPCSPSASPRSNSSISQNEPPLAQRGLT